MERRRYLDDPLLHQQLLAESAQESLRQLASDPALPPRLRTLAARLHHRVSALARALRHPAAIERERREDDAP